MPFYKRHFFLQMQKIYVPDSKSGDIFRPPVPREHQSCYATLITNPTQQIIPREHRVLPKSQFHPREKTKKTAGCQQSFLIFQILGSKPSKIMLSQYFATFIYALWLGTAHTRSGSCLYFRTYRLGTSSHL